MYFLTFYVAIAITGSAALLAFTADAVNRLHQAPSGTRRPSEPPPALRPSYH